jgi:hypothetical protein
MTLDSSDLFTPCDVYRLFNLSNLYVMRKLEVPNIPSKGHSAITVVAPNHPCTSHLAPRTIARNFYSQFDHFSRHLLQRKVPIPLYCTYIYFDTLSFRRTTSTGVCSTEYINASQAPSANSLQAFFGIARHASTVVEFHWRRRTRRTSPPAF